MKQLLLPAAIVLGAMFFGSLPVRADVIYTLDTSNDTSVGSGSGAGSLGQRPGRHPSDRQHPRHRAVFRPELVFVRRDGSRHHATHYGISGAVVYPGAGVSRRCPHGGQ